MKKIFTPLLAAMMTATMSVSVFAATPIDGENATSAAGKDAGDYTIGVNGIYTSGTAASDVISADIAWEAMDFTYREGSAGTWNPGTHSYSGGTTGGWSKDEAGITVTNHSNVGIDAALVFTASAGNGVKGTFYIKDEHGNKNAITSVDDQKIILGSAEDTTVAEAPKGSLYFRITGGNISGNVSSLGTITVTIAKEQWTEVSSASALRSATDKGGRIKLTTDINAGSDNAQHLIPIYKSSILDLNGHTLSGSSMQALVATGSYDCRIQNGTITNTGSIMDKAVSTEVPDTTLYLDACTLVASTYALFCADGTSVIANDCSFTGKLYGSGRIELSGIITLHGSIGDGLTVIAKAGTYNFDPTTYVDANSYTVTNNGNGTWTVSPTTSD